MVQRSYKLIFGLRHYQAYGLLGICRGGSQPGQMGWSPLAQISEVLLFPVNQGHSDSLLGGLQSGFSRTAAHAQESSLQQLLGFGASTVTQAATCGQAQPPTPAAVASQYLLWPVSGRS